MKNFNKIFSLNKRLYGTAALLAAMLFSGEIKAQFVGAALANRYFPKPVYDIPMPVAPPGSGSGPSSGFTFYNQRNNGSCYSANLELDGGYAGQEIISIWAINYIDVAGYSNSIAYEVTDATGTAILYRGTHYVGGDVANLNVGMYTTNVGDVHIVVAYWSPSSMSGIGNSIHLKEFSLSLCHTSACGLTLLTAPGASEIYNLNNATVNAQHIGLDCQDLKSFTVIWEDDGTGIFMKGYDYSATASPLGPGPVMAFGSSTSRIPDVAMNLNTTTGEREAHFIYANLSTSPPQIEKYTKNFDDLMNGITGFSMEDTEPFPSFGTDWDDFSLRIDVPDAYAGTLSNWAYAYFADDNNKINLRMCNRAMFPAINTYTVNNGTVPTGGGAGMPLNDITTAGNAFPAVAYNPSSSLVYVGWYTNYDPMSPSNPLYTYTSGTQGYVGIVMDIAGFMRSTDYNRIDFDYLTNRIGNFINPASPQTAGHYPKLCFSKHNSVTKLLSSFASHDAKPDLVWRWANWLGGASYQGKYVESHSMSPAVDALPTAYLRIDYSGATSPPSVFQTLPSAFLSQKLSDWYPTAPLFRTTPFDNTASNTEIKGLEIVSNPFTNSSVFQLKGGDGSTVYSSALRSVDGKLIAELKGTLSELNIRFKSTLIQSLASGNYQLHVSDGNSAQDFKLVKQ